MSDNKLPSVSVTGPLLIGPLENEESIMSKGFPPSHRYMRIFTDRWKTAVNGRHLPTIYELLLGMPFFKDDLSKDAREFTARCFKAWPGMKSEENALFTHLQRIAEHPEIRNFKSAAREFRRLEASSEETNPELGALRCTFYAACSGCQRSAQQISSETCALLLSDGEPKYLLDRLCEEILGWSYFAAQPPKGPNSQSSKPVGSRNIRKFVSMNGSKLLWHAANDLKKPIFGPLLPSRKRVHSNKGDEDASQEEPEGISDADPGIVVFKSIGNTKTSAGRRVELDFKDLVGKRLALIPVPKLADVQERLRAEFPYAQSGITTLCNDLAASSEVYIRPTLLIGPPGTGKTRFAQRFLSELNIPKETYSCGGIFGATLAGTARAWSTGEPSLPVSLIHRHKCASPGIVLDELEKAGTSEGHGNVRAALLGLLERESSRRWHDPFLEAEVNLSHVIWIATVNDLDSLSAPLRDRFRILQFPEPGPEHLPEIGNALLIEAVRERGLDDRWALPLTGEELSVLQDNWKGGSLRRLRRFIDAILAARDEDDVSH